MHDKAAALLHSVARHHCLVDGNERLALSATLAFLGINGWRTTLDNDAAYALARLSPPASCRTSLTSALAWQQRGSPAAEGRRPGAARRRLGAGGMRRLSSGAFLTDLGLTPGATVASRAGQRHDLDDVRPAP